jgi:hypothetical protein
MWGSDHLTIVDPGILNPSFEESPTITEAFPGWSTLRDVRQIPSLAADVPTDGSRMAFLSSLGPGANTPAVISQVVCVPALPPGKTKVTLTYDWNFYSEEFLEWCFRGFNDDFASEYTPKAGVASVLQSASVDGLCGAGGLVATGIHFDQAQKPNEPNVYTTGWRTATVDLTPFAGTNGKLEFTVEDHGDGIYDTAVLLDHLRLMVE